MSVVPGGAPLGSRRLLSTGLLIGAAAIILVSGISTASSLDLYGWDFRHQYYGGAMSVIQGEPLYPSPDEVVFDGIPAYVYPPLTAVALLPVTILPEDVAVVLAVVAALGAVMAALALVGVRDVRCYAAVLASAPAWNLAETANLSALLVLGIAVAWRLRATVWPLAVTLGLAVSAKLLLWPLLVWAIATRRHRAAALAAAVGLGATFAAWAAIGFQGLTAYPALLERLDDVWAEESLSIVGMAAALSLDPAIGLVLTLIVGGVLLVACFRLGRRGDDRRSFTCAIAAALALTPIVWVHYVAYLLVPLGLARPRFSVIWLLPMVLWASPRSGNGDGLDPFLVAFVALVLLVVLLARPRDEAPFLQALGTEGFPTPS